MTRSSTRMPRKSRKKHTASQSAPWFVAAGLSLAMGSGGTVAAQSGHGCMAAMEVFGQDKLFSVASNSGSAEVRVAKLTARFQGMLAASRKTLACFETRGMAEDGMQEVGDIARAVALQERAQHRYEQALDDLSADLLSGVAPAAGPAGKTNQAQENAALTGMETLFDSYMLLEHSLKVGERMAALAEGRK